MDKNYVTYEQFGAIGDGKTDDFEAIAAAHAYANENALTVFGKSDATYYIGEKFTRSIPVDYSIDFNGASFIIDDNVPNAFQFRTLGLFVINRKKSLILEGDELTERLGASVKLPKHAASFPELVSILTEDSFIRVTNSDHRDFVRFGSNENNGVARQDVMIVYKDGTIDPETRPAFNYEKITKIEIFPEKEETLTIKNGNFASICCRSFADTNFKNLYRSFNRGFIVERNDVIFENMTHRMIDEPPVVTDSGMDELTRIYGERNESYPYQGFIIARVSNRLTIKDCLLTSHTTYYEDKPATVSTGWKVPNPIPMGTYDLYFHYSNKISLINLRHECETGIGDRRYWGIMASNYCKNFYVDGCELNRFDAHMGFWNGVIKNTVIGFSINLTGGGDLYLENVTKLTGSDFFSLRGDYGSSFEGTVSIKNCHHECNNVYNTTNGGGFPRSKVAELNLFSMVYVGSGQLFYDWDFGYELHLPTKVTVDNFTYDKNVTLYCYSSEKNERFVNDYKHHHALTESIAFRNMQTIPKIAKNDECTVINSIPTTIE